MGEMKVAITKLGKDMGALMQAMAFEIKPFEKAGQRIGTGIQRTKDVRHRLARTIQKMIDELQNMRNQLVSDSGALDLDSEGTNSQLRRSPFFGL